MKKLILGVLSLFLIVMTAQAQDGKDAVKKAEKQMKEFFKNPSAHAETARTALETMEANFGDPEKAEHYIKKGELYMEVTESEEKIKLLNPAYEFALPDAPVRALTAFNKALEMGDKEKDALQGIEAVMTSINNLAIASFDAKEYNKAYLLYDMVVDAHNTLKKYEKESILSDAEYNKTHRFYTAVAAYYAGNNQGVMKYFKPLYDEQYDHYIVYEGLFNATKASDADMAISYLQEGRKRYPEEKSLLYAEINYYLEQGNLEEPISRIEEAIAADPENISLYTTLGNVFDQLTTQTREEGKDSLAAIYFDKALMNFKKALELDPESFDASYSIGALYYNKAADMTEMINTLAEDYSNEGTKKYNEAKAEMDGYFQEALPYFEKAHMLNPNDPNTVIALKEIYARQNKFDKVEEMQTKLDAMGG